MLISPEYQQLQNNLHETDSEYGMMAEFYGETIGNIVSMMEIKEVLDYGCGHNRSLMRTFKPDHDVKIQCYDPGVPEYADLPTASEMVVCIDCLEHVEPEYIEDVLDHLEELTGTLLFATVHLGPAKRVLKDGRNAHLIQKPVEWWLPKFLDRFELKGFNRRNKAGFEVICLPRDGISDKIWGLRKNNKGFQEF